MLYAKYYKYACSLPLAHSSLTPQSRQPLEPGGLPAYAPISCFFFFPLSLLIDVNTARQSQGGALLVPPSSLAAAPGRKTP